MSCPKSGGPTRAHDRVVRELCKCCRNVEVATSLETRHLLPFSKTRPADALCIFPDSDKKRKMIKQANGDRIPISLALKNRNYDFLPFGIEASGSFGRTANHVLKKLSGLVSGFAKTSNSSSFKFYWKLRIGFIVRMMVMESYILRARALASPSVASSLPFQLDDLLPRACC